MFKKLKNIPVWVRLVLILCWFVISFLLSGFLGRNYSSFFLQNLHAVFITMAIFCGVVILLMIWALCGIQEEQRKEDEKTLGIRCFCGRRMSLAKTENTMMTFSCPACCQEYQIIIKKALK